MHRPGADREALDRLESRLEALSQELRELREQTSQGIPAEVFSTRLTPLQALVAFLSDQKDTSQIARLIARPKSTVTAALKAAKRKGGLPDRKWSGPLVPIEAFSEPRLSPTEAIVLNLSEQGLGRPEIASTIGKDPRNIWHALNNAHKKTRGEGRG